MPDYAHEALFRAYIQAAAHYPLREEAIRIYFEPWSGDAGKAAFYRQIAHADTANIEAAQKRYAPTDFDIHLTWGMRDTFIPPERGRQLQELLRAKSFTPIENAAHFVHEDAPRRPSRLVAAEHLILLGRGPHVRDAQWYWAAARAIARNAKLA
ncbi:hypothetical protein QW131_29455 [Roseibium salinum]|nr:hypothetical protein [Roseibium salinum]